MDRKKFIRNIIGTAAAVTVGKHLAPLLPAPIARAAEYPLTPAECLPGIAGTPFTVKFPKGWWRPGDIVVVDSTAEQYYLMRDKDDILIGRHITDPNAPIMIIDESDPRLQGSGSLPPNAVSVRQLCNAVPEYVTGVDPWR